MGGTGPEVDRRSARRGLRMASVRLALPALILAALATAAPSPLHTELKESEPAADTVLVASPTAVTLTYTTAVQLALSTVTVRDAGTDGAAVAGGELAHPGEDRHDVLVLPLTDPLPAGSYVVAWTTAGPDGHPLSGEFGFRVELPRTEVEVEPPETPVEGDDSAATPARGDTQREGSGRRGDLDLVPTALRFLFYTGIVGLLGAVVFRLLVLAKCARAGESPRVIDAAAARAWRIATVGLAVLLPTLPYRLWHQTAAFFPGDVAGNLFAIATGTAWGVGWWLQFGVVLLTAWGLRMARPGGPRASGWPVIAVGVLLLPVVPVLSGHGWADSPRAISAAATYLHVVAAGGWVGGLSCLFFAGLPALRKHGSAEAVTRPGLASMVGAFSRVAQIAVVLLLVTGAVKVWIHIGSISDLWTTAWGRSLLVKDLVVAGVLALGFYNWRFVRPALDESPRFGLIRGPAMLELLLGAAVVGVTSYLVAQPLS